MPAHTKIPNQMSVIDAIQTLPVNNDFELRVAVKHDRESDRPEALYCRDLNITVFNLRDNSTAGEIVMNLFFPALYYNPDTRDMQWDTYSTGRVLFEVCDDRTADLGALAEYIGAQLNALELPIQGPFAYIASGEELLLREFGKPVFDSILRWLHNDCSLGELYFFPGIIEDPSASAGAEKIALIRSAVTAWCQHFYADVCVGEENGLTYVPFWQVFEDEESGAAPGQ